MNQADEVKFKDYTDRVLSDLNAHRHLAGGGMPNQMHNQALAKNASRAQLPVSAKSGRILNLSIDFSHFAEVRVEPTTWPGRRAAERAPGTKPEPGQRLRARGQQPEPVRPRRPRLQPVAGRQPDKAVTLHGVQSPWSHGSTRAADEQAQYSRLTSRPLGSRWACKGPCPPGQPQSEESEGPQSLSQASDHRRSRGRPLLEPPGSCPESPWQEHRRGKPNAKRRRPRTWATGARLEIAVGAARPA